MSERPTRRAIALVAIAVVVVGSVAFGAYALLHTPIEEALGLAGLPNPTVVLHRDAAFMAIPTGTTLVADQPFCDSGQYDYRRTLHVQGELEAARRDYEAGLLREGWTPAPRVDDEFGHRIGPHRVLAVDVSTDAKLHAVQVYASFDLDEAQGFEC